jgi:hypothetical protein
MNKKINLKSYLEQKTLIIGDVNSGKTRLTAAFIEACCRAGLGQEIAILELSPEPVRGIGGKLPPAPCRGPQLFTCPVIAPRLTGMDAQHILLLAEQNAREIEPLLRRIQRAESSILVVNDVTLYLQTGRLNHIADLLEVHDTAVINAYYGRSLPPAPFTERELAQVDALSAKCDRVIKL